VYNCGDLQWIGGYVAGGRAGASEGLNGAITAVFGIVVGIVLGVIWVVLSLVVTSGKRLPTAPGLVSADRQRSLPGGLGPESPDWPDAGA
jgi:hypothetical protein